VSLKVWNAYLASLAEDWANACVFAHGQPSRQNASALSYTGIGQNLYAISGTSLDISVGIQDWHNEKQYYVFDTPKCAAGQQCGHYTQVQELCGDNISNKRTLGLYLAPK